MAGKQVNDHFLVVEKERAAKPSADAPENIRGPREKRVQKDREGNSKVTSADCNPGILYAYYK
jgi:hypothetical protein